MKPYPKTRIASRPSPVRRNGFWEVDLRSHGFGWHYKLVPESAPLEDAIHAAYAKLTELQDASRAAPHAQLGLALGAPRTWDDVLTEWARRKKYLTAGGAEYGAQVLKAVRAELGATPLSQFSGASGTDLLLDYQNDLAARGLAARTSNNRLSLVSQVLAFAHGRQWIAAVPQLPPMSTVPKPRFEWIDEPTFRAVRAKLDLRWHPPDESLDVYTERRRFFFSWCFYTGAHTEDAERVTDEHIGVDVGIYLRINTKSARVISAEQFELPEPLLDDARALLRVLGREAFYCGERITGGPWAHPVRSLQRAQRAASVPGAPLDIRILRRSFAREMIRRGYTLQQVADRMGHVDLTMLREVYQRTPRPSGTARSLWTRTVPRGAPETANTSARVVQLSSVKLSKNKGE